ncbi:MAG: hypothetical protein MUO31_13930 [Thermodesulfovibrionales bacterium]|nr:hypothetical protein [Thermodesulfovibrionales bacterium]
MKNQRCPDLYIFTSTVRRRPRLTSPRKGRPFNKGALRGQVSRFQKSKAMGVPNLPALPGAPISAGRGGEAHRLGEEDALLRTQLEFLRCPGLVAVVEPGGQAA